MDLKEQMAAMEKRVARLEAVEGMRDTIVRYARAVDTKDWAEIDAIYTDDAVIDNQWRSETYAGKEAILNFFKRHRATFEFTRRISNVNERITVEGKNGVVITSALALIGYNGESYILLGDYEWHMRPENNMWRIFKFVIYSSMMMTLERGWGKEADRQPPPAPPLKRV